MKDEASKVSPSVLLSIDDSDPIVCPALWEAVLYILTTVEVSKRGMFSISGNTCLLNCGFFSVIMWLHWVSVAACRIVDLCCAHRIFSCSM